MKKPTARVSALERQTDYGRKNEHNLPDTMQRMFVEFETGRSLKTRKSEHLTNVQHCKKESNVAKTCN